MLGASLTKWFARVEDVDTTVTTRTGAIPEGLERFSRDVVWSVLDADSASIDSVARLIEGYDLVINAVGRIKQRIREGSLSDKEDTLRANSLFPLTLAQAAERSGTRVVQIATDCVYSGEKGAYVETDRHDATDLYGLSKSLGEVTSPHTINLRCSIVGFELASSFSLLNWFLHQERGATIRGFTNHWWNGVTAMHFARLCEGVMRSPACAGFDTHVVPADSVTKHDLLCAFARAFDREDITIIPMEADCAVDRRLATNRPSVNDSLWRAAGFELAPTIEQMVLELSEYA